MENEAPADQVFHVWSRISGFKAEGDRESMVGGTHCNILQGRLLVTVRYLGILIHQQHRVGSGHGCSRFLSDCHGSFALGYGNCTLTVGVSQCGCTYMGDVTPLG